MLALFSLVGHNSSACCSKKKRDLASQLKEDGCISKTRWGGKWLPRDKQGWCQWDNVCLLPRGRGLEGLLPGLDYRSKVPCHVFDAWVHINREVRLGFEGSSGTGTGTGARKSENLEIWEFGTQNQNHKTHHTQICFAQKMRKVWISREKTPSSLVDAISITFPWTANIQNISTSLPICCFLSSLGFLLLTEIWDQTCRFCTFKTVLRSSTSNYWPSMESQVMRTNYVANKSRFVGLKWVLIWFDMGLYQNSIAMREFWTLWFCTSASSQANHPSSPEPSIETRLGWCMDHDPWFSNSSTLGFQIYLRLSIQYGTLRKDFWGREGSRNDPEPHSSILSLSERIPNRMNRILLDHQGNWCSVNQLGFDLRTSSLQALFSGKDEDQASNWSHGRRWTCQMYKDIIDKYSISASMCLTWLVMNANLGVPSLNNFDHYPRSRLNNFDLTQIQPCGRKSQNMKHTLDATCTTLGCVGREVGLGSESSSKPPEAVAASGNIGIQNMNKKRLLNASPSCRKS